MRQLTFNFDGYTPMGGAAVSAAPEAVQGARTEIQRVADLVYQGLTEVFARAAAPARKMAVALLPVGFVLATGADTIPQALVTAACFAIGAWPLGVFDLKKKGGEA